VVTAARPIVTSARHHGFIFKPLRDGDQNTIDTRASRGRDARGSSAFDGSLADVSCVHGKPSTDPHRDFFGI
jgi:hypothetical protein